MIIPTLAISLFLLLIFLFDLRPNSKKSNKSISTKSEDIDTQLQTALKASKIQLSFYKNENVENFSEDDLTTLNNALKFSISISNYAVIKPLITSVNISKSTVYSQVSGDIPDSPPPDNELLALNTPYTLNGDSPWLDILANDVKNSLDYFYGNYGFELTFLSNSNNPHTINITSLDSITFTGISIQPTIIEEDSTMLAQGGITISGAEPYKVYQFINDVSTLVDNTTIYVNFSKTDGKYKITLNNGNSLEFDEITFKRIPLLNDYAFMSDTSGGILTLTKIFETSPNMENILFINTSDVVDLDLDLDLDQIKYYILHKHEGGNMVGTLNNFQASLSSPNKYTITIRWFNMSGAPHVIFHNISFIKSMTSDYYLLRNEQNEKLVFEQNTQRDVPLFFANEENPGSIDFLYFNLNVISQVN
jgi:hypothetical protein